jgi:hypothetical protein
MTKGEKLTKEQVESIVKKYMQLEDDNMRSESALLIAENFGSKIDVAKAKQILDDHLKNRGLSREMSEKRSKLNDKLLPLFDAAIDKYKIKRYATGGEISVYNLRKGDKVRTRKGDIETIIRKTGSGSYETIENDYSHSPESLEFVSRPGRKMATGGGIPVYEETDVEDLRLLLAENYDHEVDGDGHEVAKAFNRHRRGSKAKYDSSTDKITYIVDYEEQMATGGGVDTDFGIEITSNEESKRNKSLGTKSLKRISSILSKYKSNSPDYIDNMVANMNQSLTNKQIAQAYVHLKVYDKMKNTESVKRAIKSNKMGTGGGVEESKIPEKFDTTDTTIL